MKLSEDKTQREAAERALRDAQEFQSRLIACSQDCIKMLDLEGRLLWMNEGGMQALEINSRPGLVLIVDGGVFSTLGIETDGVRITAIYLMRNPDKLRRIERTLNAPSAPGSSASA